MARYFKRDITAWMDGTEGLTDGAYRVYDVILNLIYLHEEPIVLNEVGLAGRCAMHRLKFRHCLKALVAAGKLRIVDDRISNPRAERELEHIGTTSPLHGRRTNATPRQPMGNPPATYGQPTPGHAAKVLKLQAAVSLQDKTRQVITTTVEREAEKTACSISGEAFKIAEQVAQICGYADPLSWPPGWCGAPMTVQKWLNDGWDAEVILVACRTVVGRQPDLNIQSIRFFERSVAREHERHRKGLPEVQLLSRDVTHGSGQPLGTGPYGRRTLQDAGRDLLAKVRAAQTEMPDGDGGGEGNALVQLFPPGGPRR